MSYEWFSSFETIPGISWKPLVPVVRDKLPGAQARPKVIRDDLDGGKYSYVEWSLPSGQRFSDSSGSPSAQYRHGAENDSRDALAIASKVSEALALPGTRKDYHYAMLGGWSSLHGKRREDPRVFAWIERLCLADIQLMELGHDLVFAENSATHDSRDQANHFFVSAFYELSRLYQREGFLAAAVQIERRCAALGGVRSVGDDAAARQAALLALEGL
jgi:hypothetical protein